MSCQCDKCLEQRGLRRDGGGLKLKPLIDYPPYYRAHVALHKLWTKSGTTEYNKEEWKELEKAIDQLARLARGEVKDDQAR